MTNREYLVDALLQKDAYADFAEQDVNWNGSKKRWINETIH